MINIFNKQQISMTFLHIMTLFQENVSSFKLFFPLKHYKVLLFFTLIEKKKDSRKKFL